MIEEPLSGLAKELKTACDAHDWKQLEALDARVKGIVEQVMKKTGLEKVEPIVAYLQGLQKIYLLMIQDSEQHRDEIAFELKKLTRDQKVVNAYLDSSML